MSNEQALFGALGLCRKAGRLVMGFDAVCDEVYRGRVTLVNTFQREAPISRAASSRDGSMFLSRPLSII